MTRGPRPDFVILDEMMESMTDFTAAMQKMQRELARTGEVFLSFNTWLAKNPSNEFASDVLEMRAAEKLPG